MNTDTVIALMRAAVASRGSYPVAINAVVDLALACERPGDRMGTDAALRHGVHVVENAPVGTPGVSLAAFELGRAAAGLHRFPLARSAYVRVARELSEEGDTHRLGVVCHDIGDTWRAEGDFVESLSAYRRAAVAKLYDKAITFARLAESALRTGQADLASRALGDAVGAMRTESSNWTVAEGIALVAFTAKAWDIAAEACTYAISSLGEADQQALSRLRALAARIANRDGPEESLEVDASMLGLHEPAQPLAGEASSGDASDSPRAASPRAINAPGETA